jgi:putative transcriptional regulator
MAPQFQCDVTRRVAVAAWNQRNAVGLLPMPGTQVSRVRSRFGAHHHLAALLAAVLLACAASGPAPADDATSKTAILIVARAELPDPNFADAIVLVMNNLGPAPVGLIINRPTAVPVSQLFPDLARLAQLSDKVYYGGPVEFGSIWFLFRAAKPRKDAVETFRGLYLSASKELLLELVRRDKPMDGLRIFAGHAGWGPGQLEGEIAHGDWTSRRAELDAIFSGKSEHPWPSKEAPAVTT